MRLQLDELKANSEVELHKLNRLVELFFVVTTGREF